jgi:DNA-binding transcriptional regulator YhcF (GntR family)
MINIDISSPEPIYEQIVSQFGLAIKNGLLRIGDQLPPIRQLASDFEINPNTVAKAYQILEEANIIETRGRSGSSIKSNANEAFEKWLLQLSKAQLNACWNRLLSLSSNKDLANKIWKNSLKELRDEY